MFKSVCLIDLELDGRWKAGRQAGSEAAQADREAGRQARGQTLERTTSSFAFVLSLLLGSVSCAWAALPPAILPSLSAVRIWCLVGAWKAVAATVVVEGWGGAAGGAGRVVTTAFGAAIRPLRNNYFWGAVVVPVACLVSYKNLQLSFAQSQYWFINQIHFAKFWDILVK